MLIPKIRTLHRDSREVLRTGFGNCALRNYIRTFVSKFRSSLVHSTAECWKTYLVFEVSFILLIKSIILNTFT